MCKHCGLISIYKTFFKIDNFNNNNNDNVLLQRWQINDDTILLQGWQINDNGVLLYGWQINNNKFDNNQDKICIFLRK